MTLPLCPSFLLTRSGKGRQDPDSGAIESGLVTDSLFLQLLLGDAPPYGCVLIGVDHVNNKCVLRVLRNPHVRLIHAVEAVVHGVTVVMAVLHGRAV